MMDKLPELLIATTNAGKASELTQLLAGVHLRLKSLAEFPRIEAVEETGRTFAENAALKARYYGWRFRGVTIADDSGLEVRGLDGAPGVRSARYAGEGASDAERVERLLDELAQSGSQDRTARFVCVVAIYEPASEEVTLFRGVCLGHIAERMSGQNGFGYDPIFIPKGYQASFAQLPTAVKQQISHRALALAQARTYLLRRLGAMTGGAEISR